MEELDFGRTREDLLCVSFLLVLVWGSLPSAHSAPIVNSNTEAMVYLSQFGWLDTSINTVASREALVDIRKAFEDFQSFAGLNQTGELDEETVKLMSSPRCGVKDKTGHDAGRQKRYALQGSRWKVRELTYRVTKYPKSYLNQSSVDAEVNSAFKVWEKETNLIFSNQLTGKVHIEIRFERGYHGDSDPFDGRGGVLAHAAFPIYGGEAHFDEDEKWSIESKRGTNLFKVAVHEFGHTLGLSHSDVRRAIMFPHISPYYKPNFQLHKDDTLAIQAIYGEKVAGSKTPTTKGPIKSVTQQTHPPHENKLCIDSQIDAITSMSDGHRYVFKGSEFYRLTDNGTYRYNGVADGYPKAINSTFGSLPNDIDAALTWTNKKTYFFKGSNYWQFTDMRMDEGYPKEISNGFPGVPGFIDTATVWPGNGKMYFFKGDQYWRFDPTRIPQVSLGYPKPISDWKGIPNHLDAALRHTNDHTYFFKGNQYWRFNDKTFAVDIEYGDFPFPRVVGNWWYGCGKKRTKTRRSSELSPSPDYQNESNGDAEWIGDDSRESSADVVILTSNRVLTNLWIAFVLHFTFSYY